jgi:hypothetical protein
VLAETAAAQGKIDNLVTLNSGRVVRISVQATNDSPAGSWTGGLTKADGGIVDYYANGGLRENHVAQIAPAGAWRVWAEPETGGEAYIPFAPSKRQRALDVWAETGKRLDAFADGGTWGADRYMSGFSFGGSSPQITVAPAPVTIDAPIYTDGSLFGWVRGVVGQQIHLALATEEQRMNQGWRSL